MLKRRRRHNEEDENIGPLKGWAKLCHRLFLLMTYPIRKPIKTMVMILLLIIIYLLPLLSGVKTNELNHWYLKHWHIYGNPVVGDIKQKAEEVTKMIDKTGISKEIAFISGTEKEVQIVDVPIKKGLRQTFGTKSPEVKPKSIRVQNADIKVNNVAAADANTKIEETKVGMEKNSKQNLNLIYLDNPQKISGDAIVLNANELIVNGKSLFLYGIYVNPYSEQGQETANYLQKLVEGKQISCEINAYTKQSVATAICFVDNKNLNYLLVEQKLSKNVALY